MEQTRSQEARQFFWIAQLELSRSFEEQRVLVVGACDCQVDLAQLLTADGAEVSICESISSVQGAYHLVFLFCEVEETRLGEICLPEALVIDACISQREEWVVYDPALHYRRVRVIAVAGL